MDALERNALLGGCPSKARGAPHCADGMAATGAAAPTLSGVGLESQAKRSRAWRTGFGNAANGIGFCRELVMAGRRSTSFIYGLQRQGSPCTRPGHDEEAFISCCWGFGPPGSCRTKTAKA